MPLMNSVVETENFVEHILSEESRIIEMNLEFKGSKWDKEVAKYSKMISVTKAINKNEQFTICKFLDSNPKDYLRLFSRLSSDYERMAAYYYLGDITSKEIIKYTYLSGYALLLTKCLYEKGIRTKYNEIIEKQLENIDFALYQLIATEGMNNPYISIQEDNLAVLMYRQKYEQAKLLLSQLEDKPDESNQIYYVSPEFLKQIYMAIIEHDEEKFNKELEVRIKKYRKNMVGYSTIIDVVSVALIKIAEQEGIHCTIDVIEIPKQFFDRTNGIDKSKDKLPYFDEIKGTVL